MFSFLLEWNIIILDSLESFRNTHVWRRLLALIATLLETAAEAL
jgi:hypothetical protein